MTPSKGPNNRVWSMVAMGAACLAALFAGWTVWAAVRVTTSIPDKVAFDELPRITELVKNPPSAECLYTTISTPHGSRVSVFGTFSDDSDVQRAFPFLGDVEPMLGADALIESRAPNALVNAANARSSFGADDSFWICAVPSLSNSQLYSVYVAYASNTHHFYLEYGWQH